MNSARQIRWLLLLTVSACFGNAAQADDVAPEHVMVYHEAGRFGGWPANHGIWSWGDEILVGFSAGYHKDLGPAVHNIDRAKPEEHLLARSKDGGRTWSFENPAASPDIGVRGRPGSPESLRHLQGPRTTRPSSEGDIPCWEFLAGSAT